MTKNQLVLVLPSQRLFKSLYNSNLVNKLRDDFDLKIIVAKSELPSGNLGATEIFQYKESRRISRIHKLALDVETYWRKSINVSYETRIRLITNLAQPRKINFFSFMLIKSKYGMLLSIFGSIIGYRMFGPVIRMLGSTHPGLSQVLNWSSPKVIVCFSGGFYTGVENFLAKYAKQNGIPFFLIIDNWDNLSSKSVLWNRPNLMGVWGPEMAIDAIELQGMDAAKVIEIGSSRLNLESSKSTSHSLDETKPYVLFAGTGIQHLDELEALIETRLTLDKLGHSNLTIIYRPHPWNLRGDFRDKLSKITNMPGILLDEDISENGSNSFYNPQSLHHLENLVKKCVFLVAGHSTVIVEALYHGKKVLALTGSTHPLFDTSDSWVIYRHMTRLRGNLGITECNQISEICGALQNLLHSTVPVKNLVPHIIPNFKSTYSDRITRVLEGILNDAKIMGPD